MAEPLVAEDLGWVAGLLAQRRQIYAEYSPVFWKPASDVEALHRMFLGWTIEQPDTIALRNEHGFVIGQVQGDRLLVDDFAVTSDDEWSSTGTELLRAAWTEAKSDRGVEWVRVVSGALDGPKRAALGDLGLTVGSRWWVLELAADGAGAVAASHDIDGQTLLLMDAPPVYDPGGLVAQVFNPTPDSVPTLINAASERHAVVLIVSEDPASGDPELAATLDELGFHNPSEFYDGTL